MYTVRGVPPDDAHALRLGDLLNLVSDVPVRHSRFADADSLFHRLLRGSNEIR